ncbi:hypothetical protein [Cupriavidus pauculus]|uniref:hypothetical protein n=1 Tax=Cupriavidus pauculus TaxID=82633 RepID=UPI003857842C
MLTQQDRQQFAQLEAMDSESRTLVRDCTTHIEAVLLAHGVRPAKDDHAAALEAAIGRFVSQSLGREPR